MFQDLSDLINGGINSVFTDYPVIIWQLMATLVLLIFVAAFLWKPITKFIENSEKEAQKELEEAKAKNEAAEKLKQEANLEYQNMKQEMTKLQKELLAEANKKRDAIIKEAKEEVERRKTDLKAELASEIISQEEKIKEAIKDVALMAAQKIVKTNLSDQKAGEIVDDIIKEIEDGKLR